MFNADLVFTCFVKNQQHLKYEMNFKIENKEDGSVCVCVFSFEMYPDVIFM